MWLVIDKLLFLSMKSMTNIYDEIYEILNSPIDQKLTNIQILKSLGDVQTFRLCLLHNAYENANFGDLAILPDYEIIRSPLINNYSFLNNVYKLAHYFDINVVNWIEREHFEKIDTDNITKYATPKALRFCKWLQVYGSNREIPEEYICTFMINDVFYEGLNDNMIVQYMKITRTSPPIEIINNYLNKYSSDYRIRSIILAWIQYL